MQTTVRLQDIEGMRRQVGINDESLHEAIGRLRKGDLVRVTLLTGTAEWVGEIVSVRIVHVRRSRFEGELAERPGSQSLSTLRAGSRLTFTANHIHSLPRGG